MKNTTTFLCGVVLALTFTLTPVYGGVSDNLGSAWVQLSELLGQNKAAVYPSSKTEYNAASITEKINYLEVQNEKLTTELATVKSNLATAQSNISTVKSNVSTLSSNVATVKSNVSTLSTNLSTVKSDVATVKKSVGGEYEILTGTASSYAVKGSGEIYISLGEGYLTNLKVDGVSADWAVYLTRYNSGGSLCIPFKESVSFSAVKSQPQYTSDTPATVAVTFSYAVYLNK